MIICKFNIILFLFKQFLETIWTFISRYIYSNLQKRKKQKKNQFHVRFCPRFFFKKADESSFSKFKLNAFILVSIGSPDLHQASLSQTGLVLFILILEYRDKITIQFCSRRSFRSRL